MRNALVLVPLCIGLSSGFIVTTGTSEVYEFTKKMFISKREIIPAAEDGSKRKSNNSLKTDNSLLYDDVEDKIKKELYNQGLEEEKNINERSFVFVNQRWKKIPTKTHLVDTKGSPYFNKSSVLNVFDENSINTVKNIAAKKVKTNTKYTDEGLKDNLSEQKHYFPVMYQHKGIMAANSDIYSTNRRENVRLKSIIKDDKDIKSSGKQDFVDNIIRDYIKISEQSNDDRIYFKTFNKASNEVPQSNEHKELSIDKFNNKYYDHALFKVRMHDPINDVNENSFPEYNLFQHTLEEQVPDEQLRQYNADKLKYLKYCIECTKKANMRKLNSLLDLECKCKCGRFIHLRGLPQT